MSCLGLRTSASSSPKGEAPPWCFATEKQHIRTVAPPPLGNELGLWLGQVKFMVTTTIDGVVNQLRTRGTTLYDALTR